MRVRSLVSAVSLTAIAAFTSAAVLAIVQACDVRPAAPLDREADAGRSAESDAAAQPEGGSLSDALADVDAPPDADASPDCRGPGRYQAGKSYPGDPLGYRPCCPGLHEVLYDGNQPNYVDTDGGKVLVCIRLPFRDYGCVVGTCGDGICEVGEQSACGCHADCPDAAWGPAWP